MDIPEGSGHLAYSDFREAWYGKGEQAVSVYTDAWSFELAGQDLGEHGTALKLTLFYDAFGAFTQIPEFFRNLAVDGITTLDAAVFVLRELGAADETAREAPFPPAASVLDKAAAVIRNHPAGTRDAREARKLAAAILAELSPGPDQ